MTVDISLSGEQYQIDVDSNGDLVIRDSTGNTVLKHNDQGAWEIKSALGVNDITDDTSGNTIYDTSAEQVGDGNQSASLGNVTLQDIIDSATSNVVYDSSSETLGDGNQDANLNALLSSISVLDLIDANSGNTIYDESTETVGDGNQSVNVLDVTLQDIIDTASGNTVYDSSTETLGDGTQTVDVGSVKTDKLSHDRSWIQETGSRSFDTWYQAPSDRDISVIVVVISNSSNNKQQLTLDVNDSQSIQRTDEIQWANGSDDSSDRSSVGGEVPAGAYYQVRRASGTAADITEWSELK